MLKKISIFLIAFVLTANVIVDEALARAGGRSSRGSFGSSSTSYGNQGSRGSRTFDSGGTNGKNYAPMQRTTQNQNNSQNAANPNNAANPQPNTAPNFFQRNPFLTTMGAVLAGSWLGHMLFGSSAFGAGVGSGMLMNIITMILGALLVVWLVRLLTRNKTQAAPHTNFHRGFNEEPYKMQEAFSAKNVVNIQVSNEDKNKFQYLLVDIQKAWSNQDMVTIKKLCTPEMAKYFSDSLAQNASQGLANKVEDVDVTMMEVSESWREGEMEYATAVIEWSSFDYMIDLQKSPQDPNYITEGGNKNLVMNVEAWTFTRYGSVGNWILSAIAQVE